MANVERSLGSKVEGFVRSHPIALYFVFGLLLVPGMIWAFYTESMALTAVGYVLLVISAGSAIALLTVSTLDTYRAKKRSS